MNEQIIDVECEFTEQEVSIENEPILMDVTGTLEITEDGHYDVRYFSDVDVDVVDGTVNIDTEGTHDVSRYETANVKTTHGSKNITENGTHDIRAYETADVNVPLPQGNIDIDENGTYDVTDFETANVSVASAIIYKENEVNFYDYDGTIIYSCTIQEAHSLEKMPTPPEHEGLIFQEWNWSLEEIKETDYIMDIGALYDTVEPRTEIINGVETTYIAHPFRTYIEVVNGHKTFTLCLGVVTPSDIWINWGDGSQEETISSNIATHTYNDAGKYCIKVFPSSSNIDIDPNGNSIVKRKINCPNQSNGLYMKGSYDSHFVTKIETSSLVNYFNRRGVSSTVTHDFRNVKSVSMEKDAFLFSNAGTQYTFGRSVDFLCVGRKYSENAGFYSAYLGFSLPKFYPHTTLSGREKRAIITSINSSISSIRQNGNIKEVYYNFTSATSIPSLAFQGTNITILKIPKSITTISGQAFYGMHALQILDMSDINTVPTLANANAFQEINDYYIIKIPRALKEDFLTDTNWATVASHFVEV